MVIQKMIFLLFIMCSPIVLALKPASITNKMESCFSSNAYQAGLNWLEMNKVKTEHGNLYFYYRTMFLAFLLNEAYEQDRGIWSMASVIKELKNHNRESIIKYPNQASGYIGYGEYCQYIPGILGGGQKKGDKYFKLALLKNPGIYELYKTLLFYINYKKDYKMATKIISRLYILKNNASQSTMNKYVFSWLPYQEGVSLYFQNKYREAEAKYLFYLTLNPKSYWGYYMLWELYKLKSKDKPELLEKARHYANATPNIPFLKMLSKKVK